MKVWTGTKALTSLGAVTVTGAGIPQTHNYAYAGHTMVVVTTGSPVTASVNLEGSHDGVTWQVLATQAGSGVISAQGLFTNLRANLTALSGGTTPTVSASIASSNGPSAAAGAGGGSVPTGTAGSPNVSVVSVQGVAGGTPTPVSGTVAVSGTVPVSGTTVPTGTAGAANAAVVSVQGIAGGTPQPVSGTTVPTGTAGAANAAVVSVQGIVGGTPTLATVTDGTNVAQVLKADGTSIGENSLQVGGAYQSSAFSLANAGSTTAIDAGGYAWVSVQVNTQYTGITSLTFQVSNDNINWNPTALAGAGSTSGVISSTTSTNTYHGGLMGRYFRLTAVGAGGGGATAGTIIFSTIPRVLHVVNTADTHFPTSAALADTFTNPTTTPVAAANIVFNGATWDRARSVGTLGAAAVTPVVGTSGASTPAVLITAATTNAISVKGAAGTLYSLTGIAPVTACWVKLFDKATAPTVGTDTPIAVYFVPVNGSPSNVIPTVGLKFVNGIAMAVTGAAALLDVTAAVAGAAVSYSYA